MGVELVHQWLWYRAGLVMSILFYLSGPEVENLNHHFRSLAKTD